MRTQVAAVEPAETHAYPDLNLTCDESKKLDHPMEAVAPADVKVLNIASSCNLDSHIENRAMVSAITPYQLMRHLTAPITLADSIKTTAMVDSGAMGNFIHLRFVEQHKLATKP